MRGAPAGYGGGGRVTMLPPVGHAGPPGAGKPRLACRLTTILADMTLAEVLDTARIPRVAELAGRRTAVLASRPCRAPHHAITDVALTAGGQVPTPGGCRGPTMVSCSLWLGLKSRRYIRNGTADWWTHCSGEL